jgi:GNAT superfamily N-acetyltransferase
VPGLSIENRDGIQPIAFTQSMKKIIITALTKRHCGTFLSLIDALADFEKLKRPSAAARKRLLRDALGSRKRFDAYLTFVDGIAAGYAIIFETYSSFLAKPTLYLEDIFILPEYRSLGIGRKLFGKCLSEAKHRGCGRMEWMVLDWNSKAIRFYELLGARYMKEWNLYRMVL